MEDIKIRHRIKDLRTGRKLSQQQLGNLLEVATSTIAYWESGKRFPDIFQLKKLSEIFNVSTDWLINGDDKNIQLSLPKQENVVIVKSIYSQHKVFFLREKDLKVVEGLADTLNDNT